MEEEGMQHKENTDRVLSMHTHYSFIKKWKGTTKLNSWQAVELTQRNASYLSPVPVCSRMVSS